MTSSARISPTAHYTGQVWLRHGLSDPAFGTTEGERLFKLLVPINAGSRALGGPTLEGMLLARHRLIDHLLTAAIDAGAIGQVIEVACGLSPRGWRMTRAYPDLRYVEADLPAMAARKREVIAKAAPVGKHHEIVEIDALADTGPTSIAGIADRLDPTKGLAIITEGLLNYFPGAAMAKMWHRFGAVMPRFPAGLYLADLSVGEDARGVTTQLFRAALAAFVRGGIYMDFEDEHAARRELEAAGFPTAALHRPGEFPHVIGDAEPAGARRIRVIEATTTAAPPRAS
jgi:O-methyltransferase involved in polyketide biosynthesis